MAFQRSVSMVAIAASWCASPGIAQTAVSDAPEMVSDIIVTARKQEDRLIEIPQTVNVVTGAQIEKFNLTNFGDIAKLVPGLDVSNGGVSLRGVKFDPSTLTSNTVDIYLNEVRSSAGAQQQAQYDLGQSKSCAARKARFAQGLGHRVQS